MCSSKRVYLASASVAVVLAVAQYGVAAAQTAPAPPSAAVEQVQEVVVTARRVTERLQDVPLSIAALGADEIAKRQIQSVGDLGASIPNLSVTPSVIPGAAAIVIRGINSNVLPDVSLDQSIGHYIDGVYIARLSGTTADMADLARVEVLRGPQGTLFGRNVTQGAVNFITPDPSGVLHSTLETTVGNYNRYRIRGMIDLPEWNGFSLRLAAVHNQRDGDIKNSVSGVTTTWDPPFGSFKSQKTFGSQDDNSYFLALRYTGINNLTVTYKFDATDDNDGQADQQMIGIVPGSGTGTAFANFVMTHVQPNGQPYINLLSTSKLNSLPDPLATPTRIHAFGNNLTAEYRVTPDITLKNILAYRGVDTRGLDSESGGGSALFAPNTYLLTLGGTQLTSQTQFSEEAQVIAHEKRFDFTGGLFYFEEHGGINFFVINGAFYGPLQGKPVSTVGVNHLGFIDNAISTHQSATNKSYAAYGHTDIHITDKIDLSGGVRYTKDDRANIADNFNLTTFVFTRGVRGSYKNDNISYDVTGTYKFTPDINTYIRYATGYLSGGFRGIVPFKPETSKEVEVGLKSEWLDRRLRINADYFHEDTINYQVTEFAATTGVVVLNVGGYKDDGVEFESSFIPFTGVHLGWDWGYNHIAYTDHRRSPAAAFNTNVVAEYDLPKFPNGSYVALRADANYQTGYYYGLACGFLQTAAQCQGTAPAYDGVHNLPDNFLQKLGYSNTTNGGNSTAGTVQYLANLDKAAQQGDYWLVNLRASVLDIPLGGGHARASLWVKNLLDNRGLENAANYSSYVVGIFQPSRTFGIDLGWSF